MFFVLFFVLFLIPLGGIENVKLFGDITQGILFQLFGNNKKL